MKMVLVMAMVTDEPFLIAMQINTKLEKMEW